MKRILATTAIVALIAAPGFAQVDADLGADVDAGGAVSADTPGANANVGAGVEAQAEVEAEAEGGAEGGVTSFGAATIDTEGMSESAAEAAAGLTAEALIGADVYDAEETRVSTVNDLVLNADGQVSHILIDVGGFLGIGAKSVAIAMSEVEIEAAAEGDVTLHLAMTQEQISDLPEYQG